MSDKNNPGNDDAGGMKYARWTAWILIVASGVSFIVYTALYH